MSTETDDQLMSRLSKGDKLAFQVLFDRHGGHFQGYAKNYLKKIESAEDVCQDIWLKIIRLAPAYRGEGHFVAWAYTLIRNACFNKLRGEKRLVFTDTEPILDAAASEISASDLESELFHKNEMSALKDKLDKLPDNQRMTLTLFCVEGLSYDEIASQLELSVSSVKSLIFRARQTLGARS